MSKKRPYLSIRVELGTLDSTVSQNTPAVPDRSFHGAGSARVQDVPDEHLQLPVRVEGYYDIRRGAAGYAPIIGALGALAVPAIIVLFTVSQSVARHNPIRITFAAGLLIVAMIASLIASFGLAAVGAEEEPTANLPVAAMFMALPAAISIVNILAAFEVLAAIYLHQSKTLFVFIVAVGGIIFVVFTSFAVGDSWPTGPRDPTIKAKWLEVQWIKVPSQAYRWAYGVAAIGVAPIAVGVALRFLQTPFPRRSQDVNVVVIAGLLLSMFGTLWGARRARHFENRISNGIRRSEAFGTAAALGLYILALLAFMP